MKKIVALVLAVVMTVTLAMPAFAEGGAPADHYKIEYDTKNNQKLDSDGAVGEVDVNYEVSARWEIWIPDEVIFVDAYGLKFLADVQAHQARIPTGQTLTLTMDSKNDYEMRNVDSTGETNVSGKDYVDYAVKYIRNNEGPQGAIAWPTNISAEDYQDRDKRVDFYDNYFAGDPYLSPNTDNVVLRVVGNNETQTKITTTLAFYTAGTDTIGIYKDTLTFTANLIEETIPTPEPEEQPQA